MAFDIRVFYVNSPRDAYIYNNTNLAFAFPW